MPIGLFASSPQAPLLECRALDRYRSAAVPAGSVQRTIRIRVHQHAGWFPLGGPGRMRDKSASAPELHCFRGCRRGHQKRRGLCGASHE